MPLSRQPCALLLCGLLTVALSGCGGASRAPQAAPPQAAPPQAAAAVVTPDAPQPTPAQPTHPAQPTPAAQPAQPRYATIALGAAAKAPIVLYGSSRCGICHSFRRRMDQAGVAYRFLDVTQDRAAGRKMWQLVHRVKPTARTVRFPVITLGQQQVLVSPRYREFEAELKR